MVFAAEQSTRKQTGWEYMKRSVNNWFRSVLLFPSLVLRKRGCTERNNFYTDRYLIFTRITQRCRQMVVSGNFSVPTHVYTAYFFRFTLELQYVLSLIHLLLLIPDSHDRFDQDNWAEIAIWRQTWAGRTSCYAKLKVYNTSWLITYKKKKETPRFVRGILSKYQGNCLPAKYA